MRIRPARIAGCAFGLLLAVGFLLNVNAMMFNLWAAGGPPNDHPEVNLARAIVAAGYSVGIAALAVVWGIVARWRAGRRVWVAVLALLLGLLIWWAVELVRIDTCLDRGGRWDGEQSVCQD